MREAEHSHGTARRVELIRDETILAALPSFASLVFVIVSVFVVVAAVRDDGTFLRRLLVNDGPTLLVALVVRLAVHRGWVTLRSAGAVAALLATATAFDTLGSFALFGGDVVLVHFALEVMVVGSMLPTMWLLAGTYVTMAAGWVVLVAPGLSPDERVDYGLAALMSAAVGVTVFFARARSDGRMAKLAEENERRRAETERALHDLERELAERVRLEKEREELARTLAQAQKMDAIGTLAGGVAHDMNNVLMAIAGLSEVLCEELPPGPHRDDATNILDASRRGAALTKNLLGFSRKGRYRSAPTDLGEIVRRTEQLLSRTLPKDVVVCTELPPAPVVVRGDEAQLAHAVLNVCLNAADAMAGGGTLTIALEARDLDDGVTLRHGVAPGAFAALSVRDDGVGMSEDVLQRAFEPFFTTKPVGKGTGLGLAMVYGTVTGHGGAVDVASRVGEGTCVTMLLPRLADVAPVRAEVTPTPPVSRKKTGTVLVVDDEDLVREGAVRLVRALGYESRAASSCAQAVDILRANPAAIDVVLLDVAMPVVDGVGCFTQLRRIVPDLDVVVCSGYAASTAVEQLLARGARAFLEKPYSGAQLAALLERCRASR